MNPNHLVVGCPPEFELIDRLKSASSFQLAMAFARRSGWTLFRESLLNGPHKVEILVGLNFGITDQELLEEWLELASKRIYKRRKGTVERSFADAKQLHGHRYARMCGLTRVQQQCLLAATAQNIKKIRPAVEQNGLPDAPFHATGPPKRLYRPAAFLSANRRCAPTGLKIQHPKTNPIKNEGGVGSLACGSGSPGPHVSASLVEINSC
jgi:hypothetical protein